MYPGYWGFLYPSLHSRDLPWLLGFLINIPALIPEDFGALKVFSI